MASDTLVVAILTEPKHPPRYGPASAPYERGRGNILAEALLDRGHAVTMWWDHPDGDFVGPPPDVVAVRSSGARQLDRAASFEATGSACVNRPTAHRHAMDKLVQARIFEAAGVAHVATAGDGGTWVPTGIVVAKPRVGSSGIGIRLIDAAFEDYEHDDLLQRFVPTAVELRCTVVDGQAVGWSRRTPKQGDFRANLAQGGSMEAVAPNGAAGEVAVRAVLALGLELAGVDLLLEDGVPMVLEVNAATTLHGPTPQSTREVLAAVSALLEKRGGAETRQSPLPDEQAAGFVD